MRRERRSTQRLFEELIVKRESHPRWFAQVEGALPDGRMLFGQRPDALERLSHLCKNAGGSVDERGCMQ